MFRNLLAIGICLLSVNAWTQDVILDYPGCIDLEISGLYGGMIREGNTNYEREDELYGGRLGLHFDEFGLEYFYQRTDGDGSFNEIRHGLEATCDLYETAGDKVQIFGALGGGMTRVSEVGTHSDWRGFGSLGGGLKLNISENLAWRNDIRWTYSDYKPHNQAIATSGISFTIPLRR